MAALIPLAALTILATASISGPASVLFRAIRRVVQPTTHPEGVPEETTAGKAGTSHKSATDLDITPKLYSKFLFWAALSLLHPHLRVAALPGPASDASPHFS